MIRFKRNKLPIWVEYCNDLYDEFDDPKVLNFYNDCIFSDWLVSTLNFFPEDFDVSEYGTVRWRGNVIGWIVK